MHPKCYKCGGEMEPGEMSGTVTIRNEEHRICGDCATPDDEEESDWVYTDGHLADLKVVNSLLNDNRPLEVLSHVNSCIGRLEDE